MVLGLPPEHYTELLVGLTGNPPDHCRRDQILTMTLRADQSGGLMDRLACALPAKLSKRNTSKTALSSVLANVFFVLLDVVVSTKIVFPSHHSDLGKCLDKFMTGLVCVQNYCSHDLANDMETQRSLKLEPVTCELRLVGGSHSDRAQTFIFLFRGRDVHPLDRC